MIAVLAVVYYDNYLDKRIKQELARLVKVN